MPKLLVWLIWPRQGITLMAYYSCSIDLYITKKGKSWDNSKESICDWLNTSRRGTRKILEGAKSGHEHMQNFDF